MSKIRIVLAALVLSLTLPAIASAGNYSSYTYSANRGYGYRTYTFYSVTACTYHTHVAVYHPQHPRHIYYYNSQTDKYWGRFSLDTGKYQILAEADKKATLAEIPETAFPAGGDMPPEEAGNEALLPPPEAKPAAPIAPAAVPVIVLKVTTCYTPSFGSMTGMASM